MALRVHFSLPDEWGVVQRYLHSFTQLPRFNIVSMMLDKMTQKGEVFADLYVDCGGAQVD